MIKLKIKFETNPEYQTKTFKDEMSAVEWCRKNATKICCINDYWTYYKPVSHFEIIDAIRGKN